VAGDLQHSHLTISGYRQRDLIQEAETASPTKIKMAELPLQQKGASQTDDA